MSDSPLNPIGVIHTCFPEKFGIPRQSNLADIPATLIFGPDFANPDAVRGLEGFSHIWLIFVFHDNLKAENGTTNRAESPWSPLVRPPRLGGNKKVGVFASRSPFRPNPIGLSVVRLKSIEHTSKGPVLHLGGVDLLDQTPVLDIKPYLPYSDAIPEASEGFAKGRPKDKIGVLFSENAINQIREKEKIIPDLLNLITDILKADPRPAYHSKPGFHTPENRIYGIRLFDFDLQWTCAHDRIEVIGLA